MFGPQKYILYHYLDLLGKILVGRLKAKFGEFFPWMAGGGGGGPQRCRCCGVYDCRLYSSFGAVSDALAVNGLGLLGA